MYVDASEGAIDAIRAVLDWEADTDEIVPIDASDVGEVSSAAIRLHPDAGTQGGTVPVIERDERTEDEFADVKRRDVGTGAGEPDADEPPEGEGRSGKGVQPEAESMTESGTERHPAEEAGQEPDDGERTVTKDRGREDDR